MNEMTDPGRRSDGRTTSGLKGFAYDVMPYVHAWDPTGAFRDADAVALFKGAAR